MKLLITLSLLAFISCTPFRPALSDTLRANHDEYAVKGRNGILIKQRLSFGAFATTSVKRSWTRGTSSKSGFGLGTDPYSPDYVNIIGKEYINKKQTLNFSLIDGTRNSQVYCATNFNAKEVTIGNKPNSVVNIVLDLMGKGGSSTNNFYVQVYTAEGERPWQLLFDNQAWQATPKSFEAVFAKSSNEYYTITAITQVEAKGKVLNMPFGAIGLEVRNKSGNPVATLSLADNGIVFLGKVSTEERFLMANLCVALLLQEQIG